MKPGDEKGKATSFATSGGNMIPYPKVNSNQKDTIETLDIADPYKMTSRYHTRGHHAAMQYSPP